MSSYFLTARRLIPPILYRYIMKELITPFAVILFIFTGLLFLARSLKLVELIVNKTASLIDIVILFSYVIPQFLEMAIPMAFLLSIIIAFGRLSADSELVVMRSVGLSLTKLVLPVLLFSITISILSFFVSLSVRPWANYQLGLGLFRLATAQASSGLVAGTFNEIGPLTIYAREVLDNGSLLKDVLISDRRSPEAQRIFFAQRARLRSNDKTRTVLIQLFDGSMHEGTGSELSQTEYALNSISISESELADSDDALRRKKTGEMSTPELYKEIAELGERLRIEKEDQKIKLTTPPIDEESTKIVSEAILEKTQIQDKAQDTEETYENKFRHLSSLKVELQKRYVLPASCLSVALLALSLGIQPSRGGNRWGMTLSFITGIFFILAYYISFALVSALSETRGNNIEILMWIPNVFFFFLGALLFRKVGTEKWTAVTDTILGLFSRYSNKVTSLIKKNEA